MISAVNSSTSSLTSTQETYQSQLLSQLLGFSSSSSSGTLGIGGSQQDSLSLSRPGKLLLSLQNLQGQDPGTFTEVVSALAEQIHGLAVQQGEETRDGMFLNEIASQFQSVADTGNLSYLKPPEHQSHMQMYNASGQVNPSMGNYDLRMTLEALISQITQSFGI